MPVYLDYNATTPLDERVLAAMMPYLTGRFGNPSGRYGLGREARTAVDTAREQVAELVNARPSQVFFTSGGTEANNLAVKGMYFGHGVTGIAVSAIEHVSVLAAARVLRRHGARIDEIPVDARGTVTVDSLREILITNRPGLVSVMMANNETGAIQPVEALGECVRSYGGIMHTDAVQAAGKTCIDFAAGNAHLMSLSAHKIYGPKGAGALIADKSLDLEPLFHGGGQEKGIRAGTENVAAIVGFGAAAEFARNELDARRHRLAGLRAYLETKIRELPGVVIFAAEAERVPNTVFFGIPGIDGETLLMNLDTVGISLSSGSACESGTAAPSHVLTAMGVEQELARGAVRVSLGEGNSERDVDVLVSALEQQMQILRSMPALARDVAGKHLSQWS